MEVLKALFWNPNGLFDNTNPQFLVASTWPEETLIIPGFFLFCIALTSEDSSDPDKPA